MPQQRARIECKIMKKSAEMKRERGEGQCDGGKKGTHTKLHKYRHVNYKIKTES